METTNWGRYEFHAPGQTRFLDLSWIPGWVRMVNKPLLLTLAASILCLVWKRRFDPEVLLGVSGVAFVLVTAPDFRFLLGYVAILAGAALAAVAPAWPSRRLRFLNAASWVTLAVLCWILYAIARESLIINRDRIDWRSRLIVPADSTAVRPRLAFDLDGVRVLAPAVGGLCWDLDFPCTPYPVAPDLRLCQPKGGLAGGICRGR